MEMLPIVKLHVETISSIFDIHTNLILLAYDDIWDEVTSTKECKSCP